MAINCCLNCVAPKRHPGCHDHCPAYTEQKEKHNQEKVAADKRRYIEYGLNSQYASSVRKAYKASRKKG